MIWFNCRLRNYRILYQNITINARRKFCPDSERCMQAVENLRRILIATAEKEPQSLLLKQLIYTVSEFLLQKKWAADF